MDLWDDDAVAMMTGFSRQWTEADLQRLVGGAEEESLQLEFKDAQARASTDSAKNEISKDVSSFANSIGGTIIYGMAELKRKPAKAASITPVDPAAISKEWLDQVIGSRIHPRISGVVIQPIPLQNTAPGMVAYAVFVPESTTAHQAADKRYYKRFNFQAVPMEDYEVRQTMGRASHPTYRLWLKARAQAATSGNQVMFDAIMLNTSEITGQEFCAPSQSAGGTAKGCSDGRDELKRLT